MLLGMPSALYELIEIRLGRPFADWVEERRREEPPWSWRDLATEVQRRTDTEVTHETLRTWFTDEENQDTEGEAT